MIDDIKDLTVVEKKRQLARQEFGRDFGISFAPMLLGAIAVTLFALFIGSISPSATHTFVQSFSVEYIGRTVSTFCTLFILYVLLFFGLYALEKMGKSKKTARNYVMCSIIVTINYFAVLASSCLLNYVYCLPLALTSLIVVELLGKREALISTAVLALMLALTYTFADTFAEFEGTSFVSALICSLISAIAMIFLVSQHLTRLKFLLRAMLAAFSASPIVVLASIACGALSVAGAEQPIDILWNFLENLGGNFAAILVFMPLVAIFEGIFNIADDFKLDELCNLNHPLLKRLASEAPGTFNHSLVVGNLAEACAQAIGEDPHLARCGAYYHDVGKLKAPIYFAENQSTYNPHDELIPEVSVSMITSHTLFGEILLKQYHLPPEIIAIAREHHGTAPVGYFYRKALSLTEEGLDVSKFTYSGPKPQTKIAAIIMISDTVEAALRAYMPDTKEEFEARINKLVDEKLSLNQFDECPITMNDIALVRRTIIEVLPSIHHSRVSYEGKKK